MVQGLPTPVITTKDLYKVTTVNGVTGNTAHHHHHHHHPEANGNMASSPGPPHPLVLPRTSQIAIPIPIPIPLFPHHHLQPLGSRPLLPTANVPAAAAAGTFLPQALAGHQLPLTQYNTCSPERPIQNYCEYLHHVGFMQGHFSDIAVSFPRLHKTFALHALVLARSPKLFRVLLNTSAPVLELDLGVSLKAVHTVIGHLYRPLTQQDIYFLVTEKLSLVIEILDATHELELDLLQHQLVLATRHTMSQASVMFWAKKLVERLQQQQQQRGLWMGIVDHYIVHFLTRVLPDQLEAFTPRQTSSPKDKEGVFGFGSCSTAVQPQTGIRPGMIELARVYAGLPLGYLKRCLEHNDLIDMVQRYRLALQVIHCREQMGKSELMVVLRFQGDEQGSEISIVKKQALGEGHSKPQASEWVSGQ